MFVYCRLKSLVPMLLKKYSVTNKCIRAAEMEMRSELINELLNQECLEVLLRDSFANYVVQTALDFASTEQREKVSTFN
jgi:hypothetical protein